jgi:hypothetical protein
MKFAQNYFNKNLPICYAKLYILAIFAVQIKFKRSPHTFASGEGGPRGAVDEEDKVCAA